VDSVPAVAKKLVMIATEPEAVFLGIIVIPPVVE
jgi:hypothetical protein